MGEYTVCICVFNLFFQVCVLKTLLIRWSLRLTRLYFFSSNSQRSAILIYIITLHSTQHPRSVENIHELFFKSLLNCSERNSNQSWPAHNWITAQEVMSLHYKNCSILVPFIVEKNPSTFKSYPYSLGPPETNWIFSFKWSDLCFPAAHLGICRLHYSFYFSFCHLACHLFLFYFNSSLN